MKLQCLPLLLPCLSACVSGSHVLADKDAPVAPLATQIATAFAHKDVVFLGEVHDSDEGHRLQLAIVTELAATRGKLVISMEMFERDVQPVLDSWLAGGIDDAEFKKRARPWPNYDQHYRPVLALAKQRGWPVVAANTPRDLARKAAREGLAAVSGDPHVAATTTAPRDAYWQAFGEALHEDVPPAQRMPETVLYQMYTAQCLKDDTMAESIAKVASRGGAPVVHFCGSFHSDFRRGTVERLVQRQPALQIGVLAMHAQKDPHAALESKKRGAGDFVVVVREKERKKDEGNPHMPASRPASAASRPAAAAPDDERPGLGLMPDYEGDGMGMPVASVRDDGPAAKAGIQAGDLIVSLAGEEIRDARTYMEALGKLKVGAEVEVGLMRAGKLQKVKVTVGVSRR